MDTKDKQILRILQARADTPIAEIGEQVSLSINATWRRINLLTERVIREKVAILDQEAMGLDLTIFVSVKTSEHNEKWLKQFSRGVANIPEVLEFHRLSGDIDYLLKVVAKDIADFDRVYKQIIKVAPLSDVSSAIAMERIKYTTALPL
ncbi:MAG: Lrp/AsnC family transcriptional regulator [Patiriisocius sp.]|jgi:Lrp/AsnC family transcriptional regulator